MKTKQFNVENLGLIELNENELKKIEGGIPWFLIGFLTGALYYIVKEVL